MITVEKFKEWKKKNPNRDMEEFLADIVGGKASRMNFRSLFQLNALVATEAFMVMANKLILIYASNVLLICVAIL